MAKTAKTAAKRELSPGQEATKAVLDSIAALKKARLGDTEAAAMAPLREQLAAQMIELKVDTLARGNTLYLLTNGVVVDVSLDPAALTRL